jgi:hypothetical protein
VRSVVLGLLGTVLICGVTPYNDYAMNNTFLVGNNLPLGVIMLTFLFVLGVNGPLSRWWPSLALSAGELCVALSMMLVACCLPSSGLMRYFPASLTGPLWHARRHAQFRELFLALNLPDWLWPSFPSTDRAQWFNDPIVTGFHQRWIGDGPMPLRAWVRPALTWGIFFAAMYGAVTCLVLIVRRQWVENERLPFPLAQIQLAIIEAPAPGRWLNTTFSSRLFWVAFAGVFSLHAWNAMARYYPQYFPEIWTYYDFTRHFTERPWVFVDQKLKDSAIFFTAVGVTYFLSSPVAFSLWAFFLMQQVYKMILGSTTGDAGTPGQSDQHFGGLLAFAVTMVWVGRSHWKTVLLQAIRGARPGEPRGRYLPYPVVVWGLVLCVATMVGWLVLAGAELGGAVLMVLLLLFLFVMIARIIAETGLVHGQLQVGIYKPFNLLSVYGVHMPVSPETYYHASMMQSVHFDYRETLSIYGSHAIRMADTTIPTSNDETKSGRRAGVLFIGALALALGVGYFVSLGSMLATEYAYFSTLDTPSISPINPWGSQDNANALIVEANAQYKRQVYPINYSPVGNMTFGFLFTGVLSYLRLRFTGWPLHPIGYLMLGTFPGAHLWFSIMIGWFLKTVIVRFGGAHLYLAGRPFFLGLIVGEAVAAGFWLLVGIALNFLGMQYYGIRIMPG